MKKPTNERKLQLHRETIRQLQAGQLEGVGGGAVWSRTLGCSVVTANGAASCISTCADSNYQCC